MVTNILVHIKLSYICERFYNFFVDDIKMEEILLVTHGIVDPRLDITFYHCSGSCWCALE